jgi:hypothetical protein
MTTMTTAIVCAADAGERERYGFQGDPLRPINGKYYGYLIRAGSY